MEKMDREAAIKKVEGFVPKKKLEQEAKEELLRYLEHKENPSYQPVVDAVVLGLKDVCEFLILSGCDINEIDTYLDGCFWSPLMFAIERGDIDIFNLLLDNGADIHYWATEQEQCPLGVAAGNGRTDMFFELLKRGVQLDVEYYDEGIDLTWRCSKEDLLCEAICSRDEKIARYLIEQGCDLNSPVFWGYESVWEFAKQENALDFLEQVERKK